MLTPANIKHFYIPDEQSIYLLSHKDAKKLKDWFKLCTEQLLLLGYQNIELIGKGAFGFAFAGTISRSNLSQNTTQIQQQVFKFSRINLPQHVQDRLEEEAYMLSLVVSFSDGKGQRRRFREDISKIWSLVSSSGY